jgi:hypothetical protein
LNLLENKKNDLCMDFASPNTNPEKAKTGLSVRPESEINPETML